MIPWRLQMRCNSCRKNAGAGTNPPSPWIGSIMMAAISSARRALEHLLFGSSSISVPQVSGVCHVCSGTHREMNMFHAAEQRAEMFALRILGGRQRERAESAAMKASIEGDELVPFRRIAGQLDRAFDCLRAGISKNTFLCSLPGIVATRRSANCGKCW